MAAMIAALTGVLLELKVTLIQVNRFLEMAIEDYDEERERKSS